MPTKSTTLHNHRSTSQGRRRPDPAHDTHSIYHKLLAKNVRPTFNPSNFLERNTLSNKRKSTQDHAFLSLSSTQRFRKSYNKENLATEADDDFDLKIQNLLFSNPRSNFSKTIQPKPSADCNLFYTHPSA